MSRTLTGTVSFRGTPARWFARVTVRDEHGGIRRPWVDLQRPDLKNTPAGKETAKRLARKRAKDAEKMVYVGTVRATAATVTLAALEERWFKLLDSDPDLKENSRARYKTSWKGTIVKQLGKHPVSSLTPIVLRQWVIELRAKKSVSSVRNDVGALTRVLKDGIAQQWIALPSNPMRDELVRDRVPAMPKRRPEEIVLFKAAEVEKLLASKLSDLHFGMLLASFTTGARDGELHGLRFGDDGTDEETGVRRLYVANQVTQGHRREETPKSDAGTRRIPIHSALATWLDWWRAKGWKAATGSKRAPTAADYIFPAKDHRRSAELLRDLLTAADMPTTFQLPGGKAVNFGWHATRRTFVTLLRRAGVGSEIRDALAGHAREGVAAGHYEGALPFGQLASAIEAIGLALPVRNGVAARPVEAAQEAPAPAAPPSARPVESSPELSPEEDDEEDENDETLESTLSRLRDLNSRPTVYESNAGKRGRNAKHTAAQARNASSRVSESLTESDEKVPMKPLDSVSGTLRDDSISDFARKLGLSADDATTRAVLAAVLARGTR